MNGKKAKLFRKLAGVTSQTQETRKYFGEKHTVRNKTVDHPTLLNEDGTKQVIARFRTATYKLVEGPRLLNKMLKKQYKQHMSAC